MKGGEVEFLGLPRLQPNLKLYFQISPINWKVLLIKYLITADSKFTRILISLLRLLKYFYNAWSKRHDCEFGKHLNFKHETKSFLYVIYLILLLLKLSIYIKGQYIINDIFQYYNKPSSFGLYFYTFYRHAMLLLLYFQTTAIQTSIKYSFWYRSRTK